MKKITKKEKIIFSLVILIIIAGIITLCINGFNKSASFASGTRIEAYIPNGYEAEDIIAIAKESFNSAKKISFDKVEKLNQVVGIKIDNYTEDELTNFKNKLMEKYSIEEDKLEIYEIDIPTVRISTTVKPYIFPIILITVLSLAYLLLRNLKRENLIVYIAEIILSLIAVLGLYFSIIVISRIPFGVYTMPVALALYIATLLISIEKLK